MNKDRLLALLRWEVPVNVHSDLPPPEAMASLRAMANPPPSKSFLKRILSVQPFASRLRQSSGVLRQSDFGYALRGPVMRELHFSIERDDSGSRLDGKLQLRLGLWLYELFALAGAAYLEAQQLYWLLAATAPDYKRIALNLLSFFVVFPFLWCYIRLGLWLGRKREAELMNSIQRALKEPPPPSKIAPATRKHIPSTPTEIFIPPRKGTD